jgi:hypothetical protein
MPTLPTTRDPVCRTDPASSAGQILNQTIGVRTG